jgi:hypothetical protein
MENTISELQFIVKSLQEKESTYTHQAHMETISTTVETQTPTLPDNPQLSEVESKIIELLKGVDSSNVTIQVSGGNVKILPITQTTTTTTTTTNQEEEQEDEEGEYTTIEKLQPKEPAQGMKITVENVNILIYK